MEITRPNVVFRKTNDSVTFTETSYVPKMGRNTSAFFFIILFKPRRFPRDVVTLFFSFRGPTVSVNGGRPRRTGCWTNDTFVTLRFFVSGVLVRYRF